MLNKLLIPLDGSKTSAWVLARAKNLIKQPDLEITLVRVIPATESEAEDVAFRSDPRHETARTELAEQVEELRKQNFDVNGRLLFGDPAQEIAREAETFNMIAMTTHGRTGLAKVLSGSVALRVLQFSPVPVLLFRPMLRADDTISPVEDKTAAQFRRILVPLDGSPESEEMVHQAVDLAARFRSNVFLFSSVPGGDDAAEHILYMNRYLMTRAIPFEKEGLKVKPVVRVGAPVDEALAVIEELDIDTLVMATHGQKGIDSAFHRSVTEKLLTKGHVPMLVIRNKKLRESPPAPAGARHLFYE